MGGGDVKILDSEGGMNSEGTGVSAAGVDGSPFGQDEGADDAVSGEWQPPPGSRFDVWDDSAGQPWDKKPRLPLGSTTATAAARVYIRVDSVDTPWEEQPLDWQGEVIAPAPELHSPSESLQGLLKLWAAGKDRR